MGKDQKEKDQWFELKELATETERIEAPSMEVDGKTIRPLLQANLRNANGQPILLVFTVPMDETPHQALMQLQRILEAQHLTSVVILPEQVKTCELKPISAGRARQMMAMPKRQPPQPQKAPEQSRIIVPGMVAPRKLIVP